MPVSTRDQLTASLFMSNIKHRINSDRNGQFLPEAPTECFVHALNTGLNMVHDSVFTAFLKALY